MRPEEAVVWAVRVRFFIALGMVVSVRGAPFDRVALNCQHANEGHCVLEPLGRSKALVGQLPVVGHCDTLASEHVASEEPPEGGRCVKEWSKQGHAVDRSNKSSYDLILFVHLLPVLVCSWEDFEVPKLFITEWLKLWHLKGITVLSHVFFQGSSDEHLLEISLFLFWSLFYFGDWDFGYFRRISLGINIVKNCVHDHSRSLRMYLINSASDTSKNVIPSAHQDRWIWSVAANPLADSK